MSRPLVVLGDTLLDIDLEGRSSRLSPDAPVPVLDDVCERARPGGAGLAAALAADDGTDVVLVTPMADDEDAGRLRACLGDRLEVVALPATGCTPVKRRIRARGQSVVRLDSGDLRADLDSLPARVERLLDEAGAVLVSDYGRGVSGVPALRARLEALAPAVPVVWDPHPRGSAPVPRTLLATPNAAEAAGYAGRTDGPAGPAGHEMAAHTAHAAHLVHAWSTRAVAVTIGDRGALLSYGHGAPTLLPAPAVDCHDPCGAGDRFAATAARTFLRGAVISEAVQAAVDSASLFVASGGAAGRRFPLPAPAGADVGPRAESTAERPDCAAVVDGVRDWHGTVVATGGCFDLLHAGHVASLRAARRLGDCLVVCLNSDASVRRLKGPSRPLVPAEDRARVLSALEFVDAVMVFDEDTPVEAIRRLRPDIWAKGGDYAAGDLPEAEVMRDWGGQAVVLPYMAGRSTSSLVRSAATDSARAGH
jgi:D-beta-D-heptose 7-phosphate kinase / D-beta-D-heptose 1-phosphate adenosyltransferase